METKSKATATRIDSIKRAMESATSEDEKRFILQRVLEMTEPPAVEVALKGLRAEADAINAELKAVSEMRDAEATRCRTASKDQIRVTNLGNAIARKREMHRELVDKLKDAALISQYAGYNVTVLSHASNAKEVGAFD